MTKLNANIHENIEKKLQYFYENKEIPHILFYGNTGSGKKTIVNNFINNIYNHNKHTIHENVMYVNCAQGKGIKFIREELKYFAKTNVQLALGISFKIIVLLNANFLTIDAQSALRRCIEVLSYNTRFFLIVENKNKLLKPILSRFCEIHVPDIQGNLHQLKIKNTIDSSSDDLNKMNWIREHFPLFITDSQCVIPNEELVRKTILFYENGISCLDVVEFVKLQNMGLKGTLMIYFYKIKAEYRCEKMLLFSLFNFLYYGNGERLKTISAV
jgi:hypothetical protein